MTFEDTSKEAELLWTAVSSSCVFGCKFPTLSLDASHDRGIFGAFAAMHYFRAGNLALRIKVALLEH